MKYRPKAERVFLLIVLLLSVFVSMGIYSYNDKVSKGKVLKSELESMRTAITLYKTVKRNNPTGLTELLRENIGTGIPLLRKFSVDEKGQIVDPFGSPYFYDKKNAWVYSSSEGYKNW